MSYIVLLIFFYFAICSLCRKNLFAVVFADVTSIEIICIRDVCRDKKKWSKKRDADGP